ncbi:hypothetical protein C2G38_2091298 [Gigaspora rosea]|uniref:HAT C-terminal dimerisation domain-containing protein n=1 Tax=Gigaspora rosea TaxID=44941 RepID=A0A397V327_9GLOM|nr:hypothetical protein C2G38_2091298 [Gigaspora rosea]
MPILADFYGNDKETNNGKIISALIDKQELKQEWGIVKEMMKSIRKFNFKLTLIIPLSNAHVERVFSQHKLIKDKMRNRMNAEEYRCNLYIPLPGVLLIGSFFII